MLRYFFLFLLETGNGDSYWNLKVGVDLALIVLQVWGVPIIAQFGRQSRFGAGNCLKFVNKLKCESSNGSWKASMKSNP